MSTKRQAIESFRNKLRERNADSNYSNQFLYSVLMEQAKWLIKREISSGRIYRNTSFFQVLPARDVIEVSTIPACVGVQNNCKIYRTNAKLPDMWLDNDGPVIKSVTSIDNSLSFTFTTPTAWSNKMKDPYQKMSSEKYTFFSDGYLWFPKDNPHKINIRGFYTDDISNVTDGCSACENEKKECTRFLDTKFMIPDWLEAEMYSKALEQIAGVSKRLPEDEQIDKNPTRKN